MARPASVKNFCKNNKEPKFKGVFCPTTINSSRPLVIRLGFGRTLPKTRVLVVLSAKVLSQDTQYFRTLVVVSFLLSGSAVLDSSIYYFHWGFK